MKVAIVGAGWSGLAAAVAATRAGHHVTVLEASRTVGGRARALPPTRLPDGSLTTLDNGQHILIGAYRKTLDLMRLLGIDPEVVLLRLPLSMRYPDGGGIRLPRWPAPWDALGAIACARGWTLADKAGLLRHALRWQLAGFRCASNQSVESLCAALGQRVMDELIRPLCVSALNTPVQDASAQVFLRVLQESVFGSAGGSNLLLPRVDLSALLPAAASRFLALSGATIRLGVRALQLQAEQAQWRLNGETYDAVLLAAPAPDCVRLLVSSQITASAATAQHIDRWCAAARAIEHRAICTVYAWGGGLRLSQPMLALRAAAPGQAQAPAQFVFDRSQLGGPSGLLAFVVSDSEGDSATLQSQVLAQARAQLGFELQPVKTVLEKRATFSCTPALQRPPMQIAPGLLACADFVEGPYPSTLEGALRAGQAAIRSPGFGS